ncbi:MAG: helix-turn-helix domain-containing protein [Actinomycetota bacterium]
MSGRPVMALFDLLGRAWAMGVVWQLNAGPCTFRQLQARCEGISPSLLNTRLKELRATGLVEHQGRGYQLTPVGEELFDHLEPLANWSKQWAATIP